MLDELRKFISGLPVLADQLQQMIYDNRGGATNTEEQRFYIEELHQKLMKSLKEGRKIYAVVYNPDLENHCPICHATYKGSYMELNNAGTGKAIVSSIRLIHALTDHEQTFFQEQMINVSGTRVGEMRLTLDLKAINNVLKGGDVPPEVLAEAEQAIEIQKQQLAEAGEVVAGGGH